MNSTEQWAALLEWAERSNAIHDEWNRPEQRLAELEALADDIIEQLPDGGIDYKITRQRFRGKKTDILLHAISLKHEVAKHRRAIAEKDVETLAMTGINLAHIVFDLCKLLANKGRQENRYKKQRDKKAAWLADGLAELRKMVIADESSGQTGRKHNDLHYALTRKSRAPKAWKEELRREFVKALANPADLNRPHLIFGEKHT